MRAHDARQMLAGCRTVAVRAEAQNLRALQTANFSANRADALNILDAELAERERFGCAY